MAQQNAKKAAAGQGNKATKTSEQRLPNSHPPTTSTPLIEIVRLLARQAARAHLVQADGATSGAASPSHDLSERGEP